MAESHSTSQNGGEATEAGDVSVIEKDTKQLLKQFYTQLFIEKLELEKMLSESAETVLSEAVLNMMKEESNNNNLTMIGDLPVDAEEDDKQLLDQLKNVDKVLSGQENILQTLISNVDREIKKYRIDESVLIRKSDIDSTFNSTTN